MTKKEAIKHHREMWNWLAKSGSRYKGDWPDLDNFEEVISHNSCFLCYYADMWCSHCPLEWPGLGCSYIAANDERGLYTQWVEEEDIEARKIIALKIANLPEKGGE